MVGGVVARLGGVPVGIDTCCLATQAVKAYATALGGGEGVEVFLFCHSSRLVRIFSISSLRLTPSLVRPDSGIQSP